MQKKITNSVLNKARESGRVTISTFKANKARDEKIRTVKLKDLNQKLAANVKAENKNLVSTFQKFHAAIHDDPAPAGDYVNEILAARERGRAIMDAPKRDERNFPPARQVVKP